MDLFRLSEMFPRRGGEGRHGRASAVLMSARVFVYCCCCVHYHDQKKKRKKLTVRATGG